MCGHLDNAMICLVFLNVGSFMLNIKNTFFKNSLNGFRQPEVKYTLWEVKRELGKIAYLF